MNLKRWILNWLCLLYFLVLFGTFWCLVFFLCFFVLVKSYHKKKIKKFKTDLITSFILLLFPCRETLLLKKKCKLIQDIIFLWKPTHCTERWRKQSRCISHCYLNCDSAVQLLEKEITTGTQSNIYDGDFSFLQKHLIVNVRLASKYTSQLVFNDKNFLLELTYWSFSYFYRI